MENESLLRQYAETRDPALRNRIAELNMPLAGMVAKRFAGRGVEYEDLVQIASLAMIRALERFDPEQGTKLSTFLLPSMIGEVRHYFRDMAGNIRMPRTVESDLRKLSEAEERLAARLQKEPSLEEVAAEAGIELSRALNALEAKNATDYVSINDRIAADGDSELETFLGREEAGYEKFEQSDFLSRALRVLSDTEKQLIEYRYRKNLNQRETAARMNVSQMTISRMEKKILEKLRNQAGIEAPAEERK